MTKQKIQIPLRVLKSAEKGRESWENGATFANLEVEDGKIIILLKIKKLGSDSWSESKWERNFQLFSTYTLEPIELTFLDNVMNYKEGNRENVSIHSTSLPEEGKKVKIKDFMITYKNLKSEIPNIDEVLSQGTEIKLKLGESWYLRDENDNDNFSLEIYHDYEIIKSDGTVISFPKLTFEDRNNEELQNKWNEVKKPERENNSKNYRNAQEYLNNLYIFKDKKEIKSINLEDQELEGSLDLKGFPNLELLTLKNNQISEVDVSNCRKLKHLDLAQNNNLTKLTVYELNFFERLIADTGTLKKSPFFGGEVWWEPINIGNPNIASLKILEKKEKEAENTQRTFDLANISIYNTWENNFKWAGVIKQKGWTGESFSTNLNSIEFSQTKQGIIQQIAKNPTEWEIREELETDLLGVLTSKNKVTLLVHKSIQIKRGNYGGVEVECGKIHFKKGFTEEEWKEIEKILSGENNKTLNSSENKNWLEKIISSPWTWIIVVGLLVVLVVKWMRRKIF